METAVTNASDTPALETLYTYTEDDDGNVTRPIGNSNAGGLMPINGFLYPGAKVVTGYDVDNSLRFADAKT